MAIKIWVGQYFVDYCCRSVGGRFIMVKLSLMQVYLRKKSMQYLDHLLNKGRIKSIEYFQHLGMNSKDL